jgi:nicotinamide phosphoribosyltransferase
VGEQQMIADWLKDFDKGILSIVADTFDLWKLITEYLPANKEAIMARDGKLVIRPDSGDPVDIICGINTKNDPDNRYGKLSGTPEYKGVIELLWDIFGGTINEQGYKVLDPHIGAIYGDSITPERQVQIYERLAAKGFASTNIVLGVGSFTYQYNTRDTLGFAAKGAWFEVEDRIVFTNKNGNLDEEFVKTAYNIYKDPITDDGTKKSLKGLCGVFQRDDENGMNEYFVETELTFEQEERGMLQVIYEDGKFFNQVTLNEIRERLQSVIGK